MKDTDGSIKYTDSSIKDTGEMKHMEKQRPEPEQASIYLDYGPALPEKYNQDVLVALIRDPECIFAYWEFSGQMVSEIFRLRDLKTASTKWLLRVHNLSHKNFTDIELPKPKNINNVQGRDYLIVLPDTEYQLELGLTDQRNKFIGLVKSNIVQTPRKIRSSVSPTSSMFA